jgi:ribonuclease HI
MMTLDQATIHARQLAIRLIPLLSPFQAFLGTSVQYGHKLVLSRATGERYGQLVIYVGKKGPRLVTTELQQPTLDELAQIEQAWCTLTNQTGSGSNTASSTSVPSSDVTELWVDGACLQHGDGLQFGWAFAIRRNGTVIHTAQGHTIPDQAILHRNVGSELEATLQGLRWCVEQGVRQVLVHHDYTGIAQWITGAWRAKQPYTQAYVETVRSFPLTVRFQKVLAHSGIPTNELVDRLATDSAQQSPMYRLANV